MKLPPLLLLLLSLFLFLSSVNGKWNVRSILPNRQVSKREQATARGVFRKLLVLRRRQPHELNQVTSTTKWKSLRQATKLLFKRHGMKQAMKQEKKINREKPSGRRMASNRNQARQRKRQEQHSSKDNQKKKRPKHDTTTAASDCTTSLKQTRNNIWKRRRDAANADRAYRMAILSSLAYWEFHKHHPSNNDDLTSFRLQTDNVPKKRTSLRQSAQTALCHVVSGIGNTLTIVENQEKNPRQQPPLLHKRPSCRHVVSQKRNSGVQYDFQWYLYNWHEPTPLAGKWHDTDLLVATSGDDTLVLSFAGTASAADAFTNVQTFEKVSHAGIFKNVQEGSIHRGFLNAYSRVERGQVFKIGSRQFNSNNNTLTSSLERRYGDCYRNDDISRDGKSFNNGDNMTAFTKNKKKRKQQNCRGRDEKLMHILRELVNDALVAGNKVHLVGHSLGGGLATLLALDVVINLPAIPISKLHLWTFGAPQVTDDVFLQTAMDASPRLEAFVQNKSRRRHYHRYVTLSDKCKVDVVSTIASKALPSHKRGLHGRLVRRLGGLRGRVVHIAEPHYLPPHTVIQTTNSTTVQEEFGITSKTGTTLGAHHTSSYLQGISRESPFHPLKSNLPVEVAEFIGEVPRVRQVKNVSVTA